MCYLTVYVNVLQLLHLLCLPENCFLLMCEKYIFSFFFFNNLCSKTVTVKRNCRGSTHQRPNSEYLNAFSPRIDKSACFGSSPFLIFQDLYLLFHFYIYLIVLWTIQISLQYQLIRGYRYR